MERCDLRIANIVDNHSTDRSLLVHTANEINADGHHSRRQAFCGPWEKKWRVSYISNIVDCFLWEIWRARCCLCDSGLVENIRCEVSPARRLSHDGRRPRSLTNTLHYVSRLLCSLLYVPSPVSPVEILIRLARAYSRWHRSFQT